jgi:hypothetical protein
MSKDKFHYRDGITYDLGQRDKLLHRVDGPAVEFASGTKVWYIDGKRHRTDGPALEYAIGGREWWIDGKFYSEQNFNNLIKQINEMNLVMRLTDPRWWVRELGEKEVG